MASTSKSYDPSPERERFERLNRNKPVGSERAASSDDEDSSDDEVGGGKFFSRWTTCAYASQPTVVQYLVIS